MEFLFKLGLDGGIEGFQTARTRQVYGQLALRLGEDGFCGFQKTHGAEKWPRDVETFVKLVELGDRDAKIVRTRASHRPLEQTGNVELQVLQMDRFSGHQSIIVSGVGFGQKKSRGVPLRATASRSTRHRPAGVCDPFAPRTDVQLGFAQTCMVHGQQTMTGRNARTATEEDVLRGGIAKESLEAGG